MSVFLFVLFSGIMVLMALVFLKSTRTAYMCAVREGSYVFDTTNAIMPFVFMLFFLFYLILMQRYKIFL